MWRYQSYYLLGVFSVVFVMLTFLTYQASQLLGVIGRNLRADGQSMFRKQFKQLVLTCSIFDATILVRIVQEVTFFLTYDFNRNTPIDNFALTMTLPTLITCATPVLVVCMLHHNNFGASVHSNCSSSQIKSNVYSKLASEPLSETLYSNSSRGHTP